MGSLGMQGGQAGVWGSSPLPVHKFTFLLQGSIRLYHGELYVFSNCLFGVSTWTVFQCCLCRASFVLGCFFLSLGVLCVCI